MRQIFISYEKSDQTLATEFSQHLEAEGYTTWQYGRDSQIGFNYMQYVEEFIAECQALLLLVSHVSVQSGQVKREVIRASEEEKHILPVLCGGLTYEQFKKEAPSWRLPLAGIAFLELPADGVNGIVNRLIDSLKNKGVQPTNAAAQKKLVVGAGGNGASTTTVTSSAPATGLQAMRIMLAYKRGAHPDEELLSHLESEFRHMGAAVFIDRHLKAGMRWAQEIEEQIRAADAVIVLLSAASVGSEMLGLEVQIADDAAHQNKGKPYLIPVRVNFDGPLPEPLGPILDPIQYAMWKGPADNAHLLTELAHVLQNPPPPAARIPDRTNASGAVPLNSEYYITTPADDELKGAIQRRESIVLIKGPRQMGKTSLLARGLQQARAEGCKVVLTDFQKLSHDDLKSIGPFFQSLAELLADQLDIDSFDLSAGTGNVNFAFEKFIRRQAMGKLDRPLVWGLDEVDRLFSCDFATSVFGLFRSWHNARSLEPDGPWSRLTMVIVHATEPHLFIQDMNQSPFNVGFKIAMQDFTPEQVAELNRRYGSPLKTDADLKRYYDLVGGNRYLAHRGLQELTRPGMNMDLFESTADRDEGIFGDHLRRILVLVAQEKELTEAVCSILKGNPAVSRETFFRLRSAGIVAGEASPSAHMRCRLYSTYLRRQLL